MVRLTALLAAMLLIACGAPPAPQAQADDGPARVVSLDYCSDQFVLKFIPRERIRAVSPDAVKDFSYMRKAAIGLPTVRPVAEDVITLKPDLVVRSYGGGPNAGAYFERVGVPVVEIGWAGDFDSVLANVERIANDLGAPELGRDVVADTHARLEALAEEGTGRQALYMTPAGVTTGPGTLIHELLISAGLANFQVEPGWRSLPLERLAYEQPDIIAAAFFDSMASHPDAWSATKHPVARAQLQNQDVVALKGAWTACSGWYLVEAVEALAEGARR